MNWSGFARSHAAHVQLTTGRFGICTVTAANHTDAMRAWGYLHGRDRPFQMDLARRWAAGRAAEWFGEPALAHDRLQRTLDLNGAARVAFVALPGAQRRLLGAYAEGVNRAIAERWTSSLAHLAIGSRMEPWKEEDSVLILLGLYQALAFDLDGKRTETVLKAHLPSQVAEFLMPVLDPAFDESGQLEYPGPAIGSVLGCDPRNRISVIQASSAGSNCWSIESGRTAAGAPILACDLHLPPTFPNHWHRINLSVGQMRVMGVAAPGLPIIVAGSNEFLAWGVTNLPGDTLDLIAAHKVGALRPRRERVSVRGGSAVTFEIWDSEQGPVLPEPVAGHQVVARWAGLWPASADLGLERLAWCDNLEAAIDLGRTAGGMPLNLHLAHRDGGTARTLSGRIPLRVNGELAKNRYLPPHEVDVIYGDRTGILVTANDRGAPDQRMEAGGWNHPSGFRTRRLASLLASRTDWSERSVFSLHYDVRSELLDFYRDLALEVMPKCGTSPLRELSDDLRRAVNAWDGTLAADAIGAPLLMAFRERLHTALLSPILAICVKAEPTFVYAWRNSEAAVRRIVAERDERLLRAYPGDGWSGRVGMVLLDTAKDIIDRYGGPISRLRWSDTVSRSAPHPLSGSSLGWIFRPLKLPADGGDHCICACTDTTAPSLRMAVSPGCEEDGLFAMPGGQSEAPLSWHSRDQHRLWMAGLASPFRERLESAASSRAGDIQS